MDKIFEIKELVKKRNLTVVLPEGHDERIVKAARILKDQQIAEPVLLGKPQQIEAARTKADVSLDGIPAINTATVIQAGVLTVGFAPGINTPSSFFLMIIPEFQGEKDKPFIYADCAVNIDPTAEELAEIALASADSGAKLLGETPKVALLSFSTKGSASHVLVDKVVQALEIARQRRSDLAIDGEFQVDSAIVPAVAAKKVKDQSPVAGKANILIFPDLNSGNIAYKLTQYTAGAKAFGPFLQGFAKPISDLSRGAGVDDIVATTAITLAQVNE